MLTHWASLQGYDQIFICWCCARDYAELKDNLMGVCPHMRHSATWEPSQMSIWCFSEQEQHHVRLCCHIGNGSEIYLHLLTYV